MRRTSTTTSTAAGRPGRRCADVDVSLVAAGAAVVAVRRPGRGVPARRRARADRRRRLHLGAVPVRPGRRGVTVDSVPLAEIADATRRVGPDRRQRRAVLERPDRRPGRPARGPASAPAPSCCSTPPRRAAGCRSTPAPSTSSSARATSGCSALAGSAFMAIRQEHLEPLLPDAAGWYAGDDPWTSIYGLPLRLAPDARRFNLSPSWFCWAGADSVARTAGQPRSRRDPRPQRRAGRRLPGRARPAQPGIGDRHGRQSRCRGAGWRPQASAPRSARARCGPPSTSTTRWTTSSGQPRRCGAAEPDSTMRAVVQRVSRGCRSPSTARSSARSTSQGSWSCSASPMTTTRPGGSAGPQDLGAAHHGRRAIRVRSGRAGARGEPVHAVRRHPEGPSAVVVRGGARGGLASRCMRRSAPVWPASGAQVERGVFGAQMEVSPGQRRARSP